MVLEFSSAWNLGLSLALYRKQCVATKHELGLYVLSVQKMTTTRSTRWADHVARIPEN